MAAWQQAQSPGQRLRAALRLGLLAMLIILYLSLSAFARLPGPVGPAPVSAAQTLTVGPQAGAMHKDVPISGRWLKNLLACNLVPAKPKCKATAHLHADGRALVYAGIRAIACIPADRVRRTTVLAAHGYHRRAPPACA